MTERQYTTRFLTYARQIIKEQNKQVFIDHVQDVPVPQSTRSYDFLIASHSGTSFIEAKKFKEQQFNFNKLSEKQYKTMKLFRGIKNGNWYRHCILGYHVDKEGIFDELWFFSTMPYTSLKPIAKREYGSVFVFSSKEHKNFYNCVKRVLDMLL